MTFSLALTQSPQHSYYNGANTATARQYYLRPTQHTPNGPRIAAGTAGMLAGEFRTLWASATDNIFSVQTEDNGSWYNGLDWTPRAAWDAATEQIIVGMRRGNYKVSAYSDLTGDWRELPMPATLGRYLNGTAHYYGMIDEDGSGGVYLGSTDEQRMYRLDPVTESYTQVASHLVSNGHNGAMLAWDSAAGALHKYVGDAQRFLRYDPGTNAWSLLASSIGNGAHALMEYNPAADRFLIIGGTGTSSRATLVAPAGANVQVTDAPQPSSMSSGSWIAYHPAGCWIFKGWPETGDRRLYACWPNADKTDVVWQDLGVAPDNGLTYSTAAADYDRGLIYIVSTTGLHAYKLPEVTDPSGAVTITGAATTQTNASSSGAASSSHSLTGAATTQTNASSSGAIGTQGTLSGGSTTQAGTTSAGQVTQTHILIAAAVAADAQASASSVVQTHLLLGSGTIQFAESTAGATDPTFTHSLSGSAANQTAQAPSGVISQAHVLAGAGTYATPVISGGVIGQTHRLSGNPTYQWQVSSTGATYTGVMPYFIDMSRILLVRSGGTRGRVHRTA